MRILLAALLGVPLVWPAPVSAQARDTKAWLMTSAHIPLDNRFRVEIDTTFRISNDTGGLQESLQAVFLAYRLFGDAAVSIGYQRNEFHAADPATIEHRLRQRINLPIAMLGATEVRAQLQTEQRFRNDGEDMQWRARPRLSLRIPLGDGGSVQPAITTITVSHESFLATRADWSRQAGWARMRNQVGLRVPVTGAWRTEISYINQYDPPRDGRASGMDHIGFVQIIWAK